MNNVLGQHLLVEFYNCNPDVLDDVAGIEKHMNDAARACGATIVQSSFHRFEPWGVSGVVVISESHLAIHTWPEYGYASVDLYTCGDEIQPDAAYEHLKQVLQAELSETQLLKRGNLDLIKARLEKRMAVPQGAAMPTVPSAEPAAVKGGVL
ncbi:MAG: S-adenosylmethionine decarboxylase related [Vampirovibrio sp.]|jgi:S-adenosylmethionine decarboxylase proenzyme|nr:S-adenosylmethionine decarboxylase related [Vampirovibrio sp.]